MSSQPFTTCVGGTTKSTAAEERQLDEPAYPAARPWVGARLPTGLERPWLGPGPGEVWSGPGKGQAQLREFEPVALWPWHRRARRFVVPRRLCS
jgi:hypothetical protein